MRLVRNITKDGRGKYAVVLMEKLPDDPGARADVDYAFQTLERNGMLEWGVPRTAGEFFVIMLKDKYAMAALQAYARAVVDDHGGDPIYGYDVRELADRAGPRSPFCKEPD